MKTTNPFKTLRMAKVVACASLLTIAGTSFAQTAESVQPKGKPIVTLFGDFHTGIDKSSQDNLGFDLERAYLGYQYQLDARWSTKVVFDMGKSGDVSDLQRVGYLKNAMMTYKNGGLTINAGLTGTEQFNMQEKAWSYRYLYKSFQDQYKWGSSADLGISAKYKFAGWLSADLSIFNGEGYKKLQLDNQMLYGLGVTLNPFKELTVRAYGEMKPAMGAETQQTIALFLGYKNEVLSLGAEYNMQMNQKQVEGHDLTGISLYATGHITPTINLFARYDQGESTAPESDHWSYSHNGQTAILGMQYQVNKMVSIAPNVRWSRAEGTTDNNVYAFLSAKVNL